MTGLGLAAALGVVGAALRLTAGGLRVAVLPVGDEAVGCGVGWLR